MPRVSEDRDRPALPPVDPRLARQLAPDAVTPEAFASGKAVLTCRDSGGPAEVVRDAETGFIVEPSPEAVAAKIDLLADDAGEAERLGRNALAASASFSWETTVRRLTLEA